MESTLPPSGPPPVGLITDSVIQRYKLIMTPPNNLTFVYVFIIMTVEEVKDNYTYKIVRKVLMREYPWIKDVQVDVPGLEKFDYALFLDVYINPYELGEERGYNVARWIEASIRNKEDYYTSVITMYFDGSSEEMRAITTEVNDTITATQNSPAIPYDLRLPTNKRFMVGSYHLADDITIPIPPVEDDMDDTDTLT